MRRRPADWAVLFFRELNEEVDIWAGKGARGREMDYVVSVMGAPVCFRMGHDSQKLQAGVRSKFP